MNTWMNNPQYLAQVGHFFGAYSLFVTLALTGRVYGFGWVPFFVVMVLGVIAAAIKEFWYDMVYELPKQSVADSSMDFAFYMFGMLAGLGAEAVARFGGHS